jgi:hypothetical protein
MIAKQSRHQIRERASLIAGSYRLHEANRAGAGPGRAVGVKELAQLLDMWSPHDELCLHTAI